MLQSKAGVVNKDYLAQKALLAKIEEGELQLADVQAKTKEFFNAELLAREVMDKGVQGELHALAAADRGAHAIWEHRFSVCDKRGPVAPNASCRSHG